ncbi:MAG: TatD family hydrolase [Spirochaetaceae bacterium]|nr:TatD family hydrolase [Spirochaetaceae bacterium]
MTDRSRPPAPEPLPVAVADSHCHLDLAGPAEAALSVDEALATSSAVGVTRIVQIGCDLPGARWAVDTANRHPQIVAGVSLHPNEAPRLAQHGTLDEALAEIDLLAAHRVVRAVGETGLDHFRTGPEGRADQEASFRAHIEMAKRHGKVLVIHDRDAHEDVLRVLEESGAPDRVVFHCFSGDVAMAAHCVRRGWWLSFAGTVTFKNAVGLREALAATPLDRLLVETDAPYLTPMPYRGRPNASYLVPHTVRAMAEVLEVGEDALCTAIAANTDAAFGSW